MNVLLSSSGNKVPLIQALKAAVKRVDSAGKVTSGDINPEALTHHFSDDSWQMPVTETNNLSLIMDELKRRQITHVLPTRDGELVFWALIKEKLAENNIHVFVSNHDAITVCIDKLKFGQQGFNHIIPSFEAPPTDFSQTLAVKERFGAGSKGIGLDLNIQQANKFATKLNTPIFQPYLAGQELSIDAWLDKNHKVKAAVCRVRKLVVNGESQVTYTIPEYKHLPIFIDVLQQLKLSGPVVMQAIETNNSVHIIECNSRFGGASTLGIKAGVDSLYWSLCESLGFEINQLKVNLCKQKIVQVRAATDYYV